ncbi:MAG: hypothetical protein EHM42_05235 [Planctomycetaceae bacterium]|nr:MAG: hypothetical protein EHM42_05235 [Planctomycetaceae bacterium]
MQSIPKQEPERSRVQDEIADMLVPVFDEPLIFDVRGVVWMMLAMRSQARSVIKGADPAEAERQRIQARTCLIKAALVSHNAPAVRATIESIAARFRDQEFSAGIQRMLDESQ